MMPQRPPRPLPRPQLFCGRGPIPAATGPFSPPFGTEPSTLAETPHHLSLSPSASPPLTPPPPSVPDTTLTPSPTPSVLTVDQVYWPPPHPAPEDAPPAQHWRPHRTCASRKETHPRPGSELQAPAGSSHAASFPPSISSPRPPLLPSYLGSLAPPLLRFLLSPC